MARKLLFLTTAVLAGGCRYDCVHVVCKVQTWTPAPTSVQFDLDLVRKDHEDELALLAAPPQRADFHLEDNGSVIVFFPKTQEAVGKASEIGLEGWQWIGRGFAIDHGVAGALIDRLASEGFTFADAA